MSSSSTVDIFYILYIDTFCLFDKWPTREFTHCFYNVQGDFINNVSAASAKKMIKEKFPPKSCKLAALKAI